MRAFSWIALGCLGIVLEAIPDAQAPCLANSVLPADRSYLRLENAVGIVEEVPAGIWKFDWDSSSIVSHISVILINEILGVHAWISGSGASSSSGIPAVAGCAAPAESDARCGTNATVVHHATLEVWGPTKENAFKAMHPDLPQIFPEGLGSIGYDGLDGMYVFKDVMLRAQNTTGLALEYFRSYDLTWHRPGMYFDKFTAINASRLGSCSNSRFSNVGLMETYFKYTNDSEGVTESANGVVARCWNSSWWIAPSCRHDPEKCVPLISGGDGWYVDYFMQIAFHHKLPLAIAVGKTSADWKGLCLEHQVAQFWWQPDISFIHLDPAKVVFPPYNDKEQPIGIYKTDVDRLTLIKYVYNDLKAVAKGVYSFLKRMAFSMEAVETMLKDKKLNADDSYETVACRWLRQHEEEWTPWVPSATECVAGQGLVAKNGSYVLSLLNASGCQWCRPGWYSNSSGNIYVCNPCAPGQSQVLPGQGVCVSCEGGRYSDGGAAESCTMCDIGFYQDKVGGSMCMACRGPMTTNFKAADDLADCVCPEGTYRALRQAPDEAGCDPCPPGMECPHGSDIRNLGGSLQHPVAKAGYMTLRTEPLKAYKCENTRLCPGGPAGSCADHHDATSVACGACMPGEYEDGDTCVPCDGTVDVLPFVLVMSLALLSLVALVVAVSRDAIKQTNAGLTFVCLMGICVTTLQTLSIFSQLSFEWFEPMRSILRAVSVLSFDIDTMKMACVTDVNSVAQYSSRQFTAPVSIPIVGTVLLLKRRLLDSEVQVVPETVNAVGTVFNVFFISILMTCLSPFVCYSHPGDGGSSVVGQASILCWQGGEHASMVAVGIVTFSLVPLPFLASAAYGIRKYPSKVKSTHSKTFLLYCRFLFSRFNPETYYYSSVMLLRSFLITIVPVAFKDVGVQIIVLTATILCFCGLQTWLRPWRSRIANMLDTMSSVLVVLVLVSASLAGGVEVAMSSLGTISIVVFALLAFLILAPLVAVAAQMFAKQVPKYSHFICHHKAAASAQARLLKMTLNEESSAARVFLDSDDLKNLDEVFNIVKTDVATLVVYLTRDTLRRSWCAGEVSTAFKTMSARVVAVWAPGFVAPADDELQHLDTYIDQDGCNNLAQYNLFEHDIRVSFKKLLGAETLHISMRTGCSSSVQFKAIASELLKRNTLEPSTGLPPVPDEAGLVLISAEPGNDEAMAAASILASKVQDVLFRNFDGAAGLVISLSDRDFGDLNAIGTCLASARAIIILLSAGTMQSPSQLVAILESASRQLVLTQHKSRGSTDVMTSPTHLSEDCAVIPMTLPGFTFPSDHYFSAILPGMVPTHTDGPEASVRVFFKLIAAPFSIDASDQVVEVQAKGVAARVPKNVSKCKSTIRQDFMDALNSVAIRGSIPSSDRKPQAIDANFFPELRDVEEVAAVAAGAVMETCLKCSSEVVLKQSL